MGDQPELRAGIPRRHVRADVSQDVLVTKQDGAVDFSLTLPGLFVAAEEDFHGDILSVPHRAPNFTVATATNALGQRHLTRQSSLDKQRKSTARTRCHRLVEIFLKQQILDYSKFKDRLAGLTLNVLSPHACDLFSKSSLA